MYNTSDNIILENWYSENLQRPYFAFISFLQIKSIHSTAFTQFLQWLRIGTCMFVYINVQKSLSFSSNQREFVNKHPVHNADRY